MTRKIVRPALSKELSFYLDHANEADDLYENIGILSKVNLDPRFETAFENVYEKAYKDLRHLITHLSNHVSARVKRYACIEWKHRNVEKEWGCWGYARSKGRRAAHHWTGIYLDHSKGLARMVLILSPSGGRGGRRLFVDRFRPIWRKKRERLVLTEDHPKDWPEWEKTPCIVYYVHELHPRSSLNETCSATEKVVEQFFRLTMPKLNKMN